VTGLGALAASQGHQVCDHVIFGAAGTEDCPVMAGRPEFGRRAPACCLRRGVERAARGRGPSFRPALLVRPFGQSSPRAAVSDLGARSSEFTLIAHFPPGPQQLRLSLDVNIIGMSCSSAPDDGVVEARIRTSQTLV
jgi:hypothetical protein